MSVSSLSPLCMNPLVCGKPMAEALLLLWLVWSLFQSWRIGGIEEFRNMPKVTQPQNRIWTHQLLKTIPGLHQMLGKSELFYVLGAPCLCSCAGTLFLSLDWREELGGKKGWWGKQLSVGGFDFVDYFCWFVWVLWMSGFTAAPNVDLAGGCLLLFL